MNGVNDLGAVDALQVDRCDPEVGMPELALDHDERDALVSHLDGMGVTELVGCEATTHTSRSGGVSELAAS